MRVDETNIRLSRSDRHEKWLAALEVRDVVMTDDRGGRTGWSWIEGTPLTEFVDDRSRIAGQSTVETRVARDKHICRYAASDLLPDQLVDSSLGPADIHRPQDVEDL
jgi:hypothetical protein